MMREYAIPNSPSASRKILSAWMVILPIFMLGRVQESFPFLWPFRLVLLAALLSGVLLLMNQGFSKLRLNLLWRSTTFKWLLAMLGVMTFSIIDTIWWSRSLSSMKEFLLYNGLFLLVLNCQVNRREDFNYVLSGAAIAAGLLAIICLVMPRYVGGRVSANYAYDPNDQALMFVMVLALLLPGLKSMPKIWRWGLLGVTVLSLGALALTQSRGGLLALIATAVCWALSRGFKGLVRFVLLAGLGLLLVVAVIPSDRLARFTTLFDLENDYNVTAKHGRLDVWGNGYELLKEHPINGTGLSTFVVAEGGTHDGGKWSSAHNFLIQIAVELGIPGAIVFLGMLLSIYKRAKPVDEHDWLGRGIRLSMIAFFVGGMFLSWGYNFVLYFVMHIAIVRERVMAMERSREARPEVAPAQESVPEPAKGVVVDGAGRRRYQMRVPK